MLNDNMHSILQLNECSDKKENHDSYRSELEARLNGHYKPDVIKLLSSLSNS